jgi:tRNA pseudouridine55 synthase
MLNSEFNSESHKQRERLIDNPAPIPPGGYILLNKMPGVTSFEALNPIKKILNTRKVGHAGALDKFAGGLMIVLVGKALKQQEHFTHLDKCYEAVIKFGEETDTLDPEGAIIATAAPPAPDALQGVFAGFTGEIMQTPPEYSAIHVNGKRASKLSRQGIIPEMKARPVMIYKIELRSYKPPIANVFVHCGSGTYIRALARDMALACNSRAHLIELVRTKIGEYDLSDAQTIDNETKEIFVKAR